MAPRLRHNSELPLHSTMCLDLAPRGLPSVAELSTRLNPMKASTTWPLKRLLALAMAILVATVLGWNAVAPRPDWHNAPIVLFPLRFRGEIGRPGADSVVHAACAIILPLVGSEFIQAVLPYRNFQLTDVLANVVGAAVAFAVLEAFRKRTRKA